MHFMEDKTFHQVVVILGFSVVTILYTLSWLLNKPLDWQGLFIYAIPTALQITNTFAWTKVEATSIQANAAKEVATTTAQATGGTTNGVH